MHIAFTCREVEKWSQTIISWGPLVHYTPLSTKNSKAFKTGQTQFEKTKRALEPELDMEGMLKLLDQEFLKTMINILRT